MIGTDKPTLATSITPTFHVTTMASPMDAEGKRISDTGLDKSKVTLESQHAVTKPLTINLPPHLIQSSEAPQQKAPSVTLANTLAALLEVNPAEIKAQTKDTVKQTSSDTPVSTTASSPVALGLQAALSGANDSNSSNYSDQPLKLLLISEQLSNASSQDSQEKSAQNTLVAASTGVLPDGSISMENVVAITEYTGSSLPASSQVLA